MTDSPAEARPDLQDPADDDGGAALGAWDTSADGPPDATFDPAWSEADATAIHEAEAASAPSSARPATAASDAQLVVWLAAVAEHEEPALAALYDATVHRVHGLVLRIVRRAALAEEVVEDTYFQVWRQAARFDTRRGGPMTWLLGMARSRAIDAIRREARFQHESLSTTAGSDALEAGSAAAAASDDLLDAARGHAELHRALMQLSAQPRQLVALAFFRGLSHEEIASQTALPLGTVKSQIRRALITLRQVLGELGPPAWST